MRLGNVRACAAAASATAGLLVCTGCTSGPARPSATAGTSSAAGAVAASPAPPLPSRSLPSPGCSTATVRQAALTRVRTAMLSAPGQPFGVAVTPDGRWAFVAMGRGVEVLRARGSLAPVAVRTIPVPGSVLGETMTGDGRYLLAADGNGAVVISVARAEQGASGAVLGTLADPRGDGSAIEVAASADDRFAFVTLEYADQAAVFNFGAALAHGFSAADYVGSVPLGQAAVGMAISPDGRWLYATSEVAAGPTGTRVRQTSRAPGAPPGFGGTLTVISLQRAETDPAASVVATVPAGCEPVRVITSAGGSEVWVTARASDDLLCFSAARLVSDPARALVAVVRVGEAPVGLMAVRDGSLIVVADSNRFGAAAATSDLDVVSVADALAGRPAVLGRLAAGGFPREMAVPPGGSGTLLVTNFSSGQLEAVDVASLPAG